MLIQETGHIVKVCECIYSMGSVGIDIKSTNNFSDVRRRKKRQTNLNVTIYNTHDDMTHWNDMLNDWQNLSIHLFV